MHKEILVNVDQDETRVAVLENGELVELYYERPITQRSVGNVYKGKVENVLPGMQAAFVNIGLDRNAFLYVTDAIAVYAGDEENETVPVANKKKATIKDVVKEGQEILLQVIKEPMGSKGARVSTHLTLPGRYVVLMPTVDYIGVSRRIESDKERERLKSAAKKVKPRGVGLIVRTAAEGATLEELRQDVRFLTRLWRKIRRRAASARPPSLIHKDLGLVYRIVRDLFTEDVTRLVVDSRAEYQKIMEILTDFSPELKERTTYYDARERSLFDSYGLETEVDKAAKRRVWLKSGGYIVIDQTEALTVIDVNTGKFVGSTNLADTVLKTNLEAAREIARQLRLRDIGGIIVADFIDMENGEHRQEMLRTLHEELKKDRTKTNVLGLTQLGLVEMTRKKMKQGLEAVLLSDCPYCEGTGKVLSEATMAARTRRELRRLLGHTENEAILVEVHPSVASLLIGANGANLKVLEKETRKIIYIRGNEECHVERMNIRLMGTKEEVERRALPVHPGEQLEVRVEEPHVSNPHDGIARIEGYVLDIEGGGKLVGERVRVQVKKAFRTYAKAVIVQSR
ncbi:MAG: Rne/Rng family ribonuclease [Bacillota bacterium]